MKISHFAQLFAFSVKIQEIAFNIMNSFRFFGGFLINRDLFMVFKGNLQVFSGKKRGF